jgi:hypothetical protein
MKKLYYLFSILLIPAMFVLMAPTGGAPAGYTGSPLDGQNCSNCHTGSAVINVDNLITTTIPTEGYTPGETYTVVFSAGDLTADKYGFQITSETSSAKTGSWIITNSTRTALAGTTAVTHTSAGTTPAGSPNSWTMDWTAPADGTGDVMFYAVLNKTNNNGASSGDEIFTSMLTVQESTIGVPEMADETLFNVYPNPATDKINIALTENAVVSIFDNSGRIIREVTASDETLILDVSGLEQGIYFLRINSNGKLTTRTFIKK